MRPESWKPDARPLLAITNWRDAKHAEAGGAEVVCEEIARRLANLGYNVVVLCASVGGAPSSESANGITLVRRGGRFTVYPWALLWLLRHRSTLNAVIDSQNGIPFFTPLVVRRKIPIVLLLHHIHQEQFSKYFPRPVAALGRWLEGPGCRRVYGRRAIVAVSPSTRAGVRKQLRLRGSIRVVPPGSSITTLSDDAHLARTASPSIVCVGRLVPHKRQHLIVGAVGAMLKQYPDLKVHMVGSGPDLEGLRRLSADCGAASAVTFHEHVSDAVRDGLLRTSWLTINASQGEGWGLSIIEANAFGVPALAFRRPGLRDSIREGVTGWLIDDDADLSAAAANCLALLSNPAVADQVALAARKWAAQFTWDRMAQQFAMVLQGEEMRLRLPHPDRRVQTDLATVVHLPEGVLPPGWSPRLRRTDAWVLSDDGLRLFLAGSDTAAVEAAMGRFGIDVRVFQDGRASASVARTSDHLLPLTFNELAVDLRTREQR